MFPGENPLCTAIATLAIGLLSGCDSLEPDCNVRPWVSARDTVVAAFDSVRIRAESEDACGKNLRYLWSWDGGMTYDTTAAGVLVKFFGREDLGRKTLRIRAVTDQGRASGPTDITVTVQELRFAWRPARDTLVHFGDSVALVDLTPAEPIPGIAAYCLRLYPESPCTDSSSQPVFRIPSSRSLYSLQKYFAEVRLASGARSDTAGIVVLSRPTLLGPGYGSAPRAAVLPGGSLRVIMPSMADSGITNPRTGQRLQGIRTLEITAQGKVIAERVSRPTRDIGLSLFALRPDGSGLFLGVDNLEPEKADFLAGGLDPAGNVLWTRAYDLDTSFTRTLAVWPKEDGTWRVVMAGYASEGEGNGKPATRNATSIHFIDLAASGEMLRDKRVLIAGLKMTTFEVLRLQDGGTVLAGMGGPEGAREIEPLMVIRHDAEGGEVWSKTFRSREGSSRADLLQRAEDGNLVLAGTDFGQPASHWILRLALADGSELSHRIVVHPAGWNLFGPVRTSQGTLLYLGGGNGEKGHLLWAADDNGLEKWRLRFARGTTDTYLSSMTPLPDGSFLVNADARLGIYRNDPASLVFLVDGDGKVRW
jgi:hypothetical protein